MKKNLTIASVVALLLAASWSQSVLAQGNCGNIEFAGDVTSRFPNAAAACLDLVDREGTQYAHFLARITRTRGNTVEAEFKLPNGAYSRTVEFTPDPAAHVYIGGRAVRYRDLENGQELGIYLPPDRWEIVVYEEPTLAAAQTVTFVALTEPTVGATLPRTASPLPLLGLLGVLLVSLGGLTRVLRTRWMV